MPVPLEEKSCIDGDCPRGSLESALAFPSSVMSRVKQKDSGSLFQIPSLLSLGWPSVSFSPLSGMFSRMIALACLVLPRSDSWLLLKVQLGKTWLINRQPPSSPSCLPAGVINQGERLTFLSVVNPRTSKVWQQNGHWVLAHLGFLRSPPSPAER